MAYTLTLKTNGKAGEGAAPYKAVDGLVAPSADSPLVTGVGTVSGKKPTTNRASTKDDSGLPVLPIGLGVIGVVLLGGAYTAFRRARASG